MRLILDSRLAGLLVYYRAFPREPSRARELDLAIERIVPIPDITLMAVLHALADAADAREPVGLIAARGDARGFAMPIAPGAWGRRVPATRDTLRSLDEIERGLHDPGRAARGDLQIPPDQLAELRAALRRVRGRFRRIEVRSAPLGADPLTLAGFRDFFGAGQLLAPAVGAFDVTVNPRVIANRGDFARRIDAEVGLTTGVLYPSGPEVGRWAPPDLFAPRRAAPDPTRGGPGGRFFLKVWEAGSDPHPRFGSTSSATDVESVREFVDRRIMPGSAYAGGPFPLAGLWTNGRSALAASFVLPGDPPYRELIACDPPTSNGRDVVGEWSDLPSPVPPSARERVPGPG